MDAAENPAEEASGRAARRRTSILLRVLAFIVLVSAWLAVYNLHHLDTSAQIKHYGTRAANEAAYVELDITLVSFNPQRGELLVRIRPTPQGQLEQNGRLTESLAIETNASTGRVDSIYKKGDTMAGIEATIGVDDGDPGDYPADRYATTLAALVTHTESDGSVDALPATINVDETLDGFLVQADEVPSKVGVVFLTLRMERNHSVRAFANFVIVLMLLIGLISLVVTFELIRDERKRLFEINVVQWLAALLFALPPLRGAMPGAPAIGAQCDYISFFWAEAGVALCMLTLMMVWLSRRLAA